MGDTNPIRRQFVEKKINLPLIFQLVILLRNRKEMMYLCTRSSLALRIVGLCELAFKKDIESKDGIIVLVKGTETNILKEFTMEIAEVKLDYKNLVKYLNGEKVNLKGLKNLRTKVYKEMENRGLIKIKKGMIFNNIKLNRIEIWQEVYNKLIFEVINNCMTKETIALMIALDYVNSLESILLHCSESIAVTLITELVKIKESICLKSNNEENKLFYEFLSILNK